MNPLYSPSGAAGSGSRRQFLKQVGVGGILALSRQLKLEHSIGHRGFFHIDHSSKQTRLLTPAGKPFFSLGINHLDPVTLRHAENLAVWRDTYDNSMQKWLRKVRKDLTKWGFNSVGWVKDVATRQADHHRHSRNWTYEEYQWLNLPYCHMLPFADFHHYESEMRHPDFFSKGFEQWCDYVARDHCARFADDPNLIGYFYLDCPAWIHTRKES